MKNALAISPAEVSAPKSGKKDSENRGELTNIDIEVTENGCVVCCSFNPETINSKMDRYSQMPEDEKKSFEDNDRAVDYIRAMLNGEAQDEADEDKPAKKDKSKKA